MKGAVYRLVVVLFLVAGGGSAPAAANPQAERARGSGLHGQATKGPLTPVCRDGVPCYAPAARTKLFFLQHGRVVAQTRTDAGGLYRIALRPGRYSVESTIGFGVVKPPEAVVRRGRFSRVDLVLDTGIR